MRTRPRPHRLGLRLYITQRYANLGRDLQKYRSTTPATPADVTRHHAVRHRYVRYDAAPVVVMSELRPHDETRVCTESPSNMHLIARSVEVWRLGDERAPLKENAAVT
jgi:hypothetical protein